MQVVYFLHFLRNLFLTWLQMVPSDTWWATPSSLHAVKAGAGSRCVSSSALPCACDKVLAGSGGRRGRGVRRQLGASLQGRGREVGRKPRAAPNGSQGPWGQGHCPALQGLTETSEGVLVSLTGLGKMHDSRTYRFYLASNTTVHFVKVLSILPCLGLFFLLLQGASTSSRGFLFWVEDKSQ